MQQISSAAFSDTKPHYELLDGLRGVAALLVVWYHVFEGYAFAGGTLIESINHGYLAVDFFFILSGFVIGYAYDDRWGKSLTVKNFFKRRLIRLHPMVVMGAVLGVITFCIQGSEQWDGTHVATSMVMWALLFAMFFIPAYPGAGYEVRGVAMSVCTFALWGACFILTYTFPVLNNGLGAAGTFWLYGIICLAGGIFVVFCLPETKGKSLEELEKELIK